MALGSAAFAGANWASTADLVPPGEAARFFGLANFGTAGAVAAAGFFGLLVDWANETSPGGGYVALLVVAGIIFVASAIAAWASQRSLGAWLPAYQRTEHVAQRMEIGA
jgi:MFS family permease